MVCPNDDSVVVMRFAAEVGDYGAAEGGPRAVFLFAESDVVDGARSRHRSAIE